MKSRTILLFVLLFIYTSLLATSRPTPIQAKSGCELWTGKASGNDPSVLIEIRLCQNNQNVTGQMQWSSLHSGWNKRRLVGFITSENISIYLQDLSFISNKPRSGWRFCLIDSYELRRIDPYRLSRFYWSAACQDRAQLLLYKKN